jgi:hypothetical protein
VGGGGGVAQGGPLGRQGRRPRAADAQHATRPAPPAGDRLCFGQAAEEARASGVPLEVVYVGEDVAIDAPGLAGRRGLAGTALVHKVAGAAAAAGRGLDGVAAAARGAAGAMGTLGVALRWGGRERG